jgi:glycosyltransferase involved in cell wall biosynthesis
MYSDTTQPDRPELATRTTTPARQLRHGGHVGIVLPCYNEEGNVEEAYTRIAKVFAALPGYTFEILFIDNASTDRTVEVLRGIVASDSRVRVIVNARDFGWIRSPFHGMMQVGGDCVIQMCSDLQEPPEVIPQFLSAWENGAAVVVGQKTTSPESLLFWGARSLYYKFARSIADVPLLEHVTGFGLYDRRVIEIMRGYRDPYPYVRGLISDVGLPIAVVKYDQATRRRGITKSNLSRLFDVAMLGITSHSKAPLRLATIAGFILSGLSLLVALLFLMIKLLFWFALPSGYAPVVIGVFFLGSVQIFLIGLLGEYLSAVLAQVRNRPLVVERERIGVETYRSGDPGSGPE